MDYGQENSESGAAEEFALLGRRAGAFLEVLAYNFENGRVLCLFETQNLADAFSRVNPEIRGQGWAVHMITTDKLPSLVEDFDYVTINPSPHLKTLRKSLPPPSASPGL